MKEVRFLIEMLANFIVVMIALANASIGCVDLRAPERVGGADERDKGTAAAQGERTNHTENITAGEN